MRKKIVGDRVAVGSVQGISGRISFINRVQEEMINDVLRGGVDFRAKYIASEHYDPKEVLTAITDSATSFDIRILLLETVRKGTGIYNGAVPTGANLKTDTPLLHQLVQITAFTVAVLRGLQPRELLVLPPSTLLAEAARILDGTEIKLCAQDFSVPKTSLTKEMTGATSTLSHIQQLGIVDALVMHSEKRLDVLASFLQSGSTYEEAKVKVNNIANWKLQALIDAGMGYKLCVGDFLHDRYKYEESRMARSFEGIPYLSKFIYKPEDFSKNEIEGNVIEFIVEQLEGAYKDIKIEDIFNNVLLRGRNAENCNEPCWAISGYGAKRSATVEEAEFVNRIMTEWQIKKHGLLAAFIIQGYGGSVNPGNVVALRQSPFIRSSLVGGASFDKDNKGLVNLITQLEESGVTPRKFMKNLGYYKSKIALASENEVPSIFKISEENNPNP